MIGNPPYVRQELIPEALMRASEKARKLAEQTGTPFVVRKPASAEKQSKS